MFVTFFAWLVFFAAVHPRREPGGVRTPDRHAKARKRRREGEGGG